MEEGLNLEFRPSFEHTRWEYPSLSRVQNWRGFASSNGVIRWSFSLKRETGSASIASFSWILIDGNHLVGGVCRCSRPTLKVATRAQRDWVICSWHLAKQTTGAWSRGRATPSGIVTFYYAVDSWRRQSSKTMLAFRSSCTETTTTTTTTRNERDKEKRSKLMEEGRERKFGGETGQRFKYRERMQGVPESSHRYL